MELVYPIYIDTPMMTSFLASLEGGLVEETALEEKTASSKEKGKSGGGGAKVGGLLSGLISVDAKAEASQKVIDSLESNYKSTVRFPEAALFIRLRELLKQEGLMRTLSDEFSSAKMGELIEFSGMVSPNPAFQIRRFSQHLAPLMESITNMQTRQLENQIQMFEKAKPNQTLKIGDTEIQMPGQSEINMMKMGFKMEMDNKKSESEGVKDMMNGIEHLMPQDQIDKLIFDTGSYKAVCSVYPDFARNQRIQDIHNSHWRCIGKIIGKIEDGHYDLMQGMPAGYFASNMLGDFTQSLNNDDVNLDLTESKIEGPVLVIAALAIFA